MTSIRLPEHQASTPLTTITEPNRLMDAQAAEIKELKAALAAARPPFDPAVFTVFCRESTDTGTTWIDTVRVDPTGRTAEQLLEDIKLVAVHNCAVDWGWEDTSGITCYCIIPGEPGVLFFEDLGDC